MNELIRFRRNGKIGTETQFHAPAALPETSRSMNDISLIFAAVIPGEFHPGLGLSSAFGYVPISPSHFVIRLGEDAVTAHAMPHAGEIV
jgi:hypothetical protein